MKLTLRQVVDAAEPLQYIGNQKLPAKDAFTVGAILKAFQSPLETYNEVQQKLLTQYAKQGEENPQMYQFPDNAMREAFDKERNAVLDSKIEVRVPLINFSVLEPLSLTPSQIVNIGFLLKNPPELEMED